MNNCPSCDSSVVWAVAAPQTKSELLCGHCNYSFSPPTITKSFKYGVLEGDWEEPEVEKVRSSIPGEADNWVFIKGKKLWFAFRANWLTDQIITCRMLDDLIYWVQAAVRNPNWRSLYRRSQ